MTALESFFVSACQRTGRWRPHLSTVEIAGANRRDDRFDERSKSREAAINAVEDILTVMMSRFAALHRHHLREP
jgi:hypothetical protein